MWVRTLNEKQDMRKMPLAYEQQSHRQMESPAPENSKCTGFFCKYGASHNVNANSTNVTDWLLPSTTTETETPNLSNESTNNAKVIDPNSYSNSDSAAEDDGLKGAITFGLIMSVGIYYFTRAAMRRRLYSRILRKLKARGENSAPAATCTCTGTVIKKQSRSIWEFRGSDAEFLAVQAGVIPVAETYQHWPLAPFHLFVCYEAPTTATAETNPSSEGQGTEITIKKLENVSKKRFMSTTPGDSIELVCFEGKPRSGMIPAELQFSRSVALEDMVLWSFLVLFPGAAFYTLAVRHINDMFLASTPVIVAALCLLISFVVNKAHCHMMEEKLIDGKHHTSKTLFTIAVEEPNVDGGVDDYSPEPNEPREVV